MNNERYLRAKRSSFIINVVETPNGFSIVEGIELLNKPEGINTNQQNSIPTLTTSNQHSAPPPKQYKPVFKKTNLVFLKRKDGHNLDSQTADEETVVTPQFCKIYAEWFDLNRIHLLQRRQVVQWFCQKAQCTPQEAQDRQQLTSWLKNYKKHRNFIVKLYVQEFAEQQKYLSASCIRRYICCDSFWIMKLHLLLSNFGVINSHTPTFAIEASSQPHILKLNKEGKKQLLPYQLTTQIQNGSKQDQNQLLKRLTSELRPYCDYCRIHCGIVWFQHTRSLDPKQIANIMKNVNSKNPPLSQKQYEYILCVRCYCQSNFPLLLTHHDFKKICVNDKIDPSRKKRSKIRKREKRRRQQGAVGQEQQEPKEQNQEKSHLQDQEQGERKKEEIKAAISKLVSSVKTRFWTLQQTNLLLELVQKYQEDWTAIRDEMRKHGHCKNIQTEQLIHYFLTLPQRGVIQLQEQYQDQQFVQANFSNNRISLQDRLSERKLNDSFHFASQASKQILNYITQEASRQDYPWKNRLEEIIRLQMRKYENRFQHLQNCESLVKSLHIFDNYK